MKKRDRGAREKQKNKAKKDDINGPNKGSLPLINKAAEQTAK